MNTVMVQHSNITTQQIKSGHQPHSWQI